MERALSPDFQMFISPTSIDKPDEDGERGTGYNYGCDAMLTGYEIPLYTGELDIIAPFKYQVAGHDAFLKASNGLLCKPFVARELWFYLEVAKSFLHFSPFLCDFLGCVDYSREEIYTFISKNEGKSDTTEYITPWAAKVHDGHLKRIHSRCNIPEEKKQRYLILKDLTFNLEWPCIMDLKMGQRAYGDDATPKKIASQTLKSKQTTSYETGLRICGCQGYSAVRKEFWQLHKYEGRKIRKATIPLAFEKFFHNDQRLRTDVIEQFLTRLEHLASIVEKKEFRFYSSSLLLVYNGAVEKPEVEMKMIDFAHTFPANDKPSDDGYLFGLRNLISLFTSLLE